VPEQHGHGQIRFDTLAQMRYRELRVPSQHAVDDTWAILLEQMTGDLTLSFDE
jgi:hypothetical protein